MADIMPWFNIRDNRKLRGVYTHVLHDAAAIIRRVPLYDGRILITNTIPDYV